jgi:protein-tyrosine phosphatase
MEASSQRAQPPIGLLFVCMGNICRSPLAEGVFIHLAEQRGVRERFLIDSAGTGAWHVGKPADARSIEIARKYGVSLPSIARQISPDDWATFHRVLVMDKDNHRRVVRAGAPPARVDFLRAFDPALADETDPDQLAVPDPYYGGPEGFELIYQQIHSACTGLLEWLLRDPDAAR